MKTDGKSYQTCQKLAGFLTRQRRLLLSGKEAESCLIPWEKEEEAYHTKKILPLGIELVAIARTSSSHLTLQIWLDSDKFWIWTKDLGQPGLVYIETYGLEIGRNEKSGTWGLQWDGEELLLRPVGSGSYLLAEVLMAEKGDGNFAVNRIA